MDEPKQRSQTSPVLNRYPQGAGAASGLERKYLIGDLAREFGVSLRTLRFYEDRGLLQPRREGNTRIYDAREKARLALILKGKHLGFTLTEIRMMLDADQPASGGDLSLDLRQVEEQISHLQSQKSELERALEELHTYRDKLTGSL